MKTITTTTTKRPKMDETKSIQFKNLSLDVQRNGRVLFEGKELKSFAMPNGRIYVQVYDKTTKKGVLISVARAVAMAFVACPGNFEDYQVDHIDNDLAHNAVSNLRWMTRKENNSRKHAREMKSKNSRYSKHDGQVIQGINVKTGEVRVLGVNGHDAAKTLGCSHVLVYNALNQNLPYVKTAKGWKLEWVSSENN